MKVENDEEECSSSDFSVTPASASTSPVPSSEDPNQESSRAKKRRKQSNPTRYGNSVPVTTEREEGELTHDDDIPHTSLAAHLQATANHSFQSNHSSSSSSPKHFCPHCNSSFVSDDRLKKHIEEEHVQKVLERQLLQHQAAGKASNGSSMSRDHLSDVAALLLSQQRVGEPRSRGGSSRSSENSDSLSNSPSGSPTGRKSFDSNHSLRNPMKDFLPFQAALGGSGPEGKGPGGLGMGMFPNPFLFLPHSNPSGQPGSILVQSGSAIGANGTGGGGPLSGGGGIGGLGGGLGGGGFRIFNPEAYCELCEKEFCNKYFLKTHKANKHGIYCQDTPTSGPPGSSSFTSSAPTYFTSSLSSSAAAQMHQMLQHASGSAGTSEAAQVAAAAMVARGLGMVNLESFCEICQKEFCNKYFLRKHKQKIHGISDGSLSGRQASGSGSPNSNSEGGEQQSQPPSSPQMTLVSPPPTPDKSSTGHEGTLSSSDICKQEFPNQMQLQAAHKALASQGGGTGPSSRPNPTLSPIAHLQTMAALQAESLAGLRAVGVPESSERPRDPMMMMNSENHHRGGGGGSVSGDNNSRSAMDDKMRNVTGRNYCNICNKELCNKYFMKTHMLKMHGINIDEHPAEAAVTSTIGGVTCDICQKELCSKYFLKVHKQNTHGFYEDSNPTEGGGRKESSHHKNHTSSSTPSSETSEKEAASIAAQGIDPNDTSNRYFNHYTEVCPLCERRFKSVKWRDTHMRNDHSDHVLGAKAAFEAAVMSAGKSYKMSKSGDGGNEHEASRSNEDEKRSPTMSNHSSNLLPFGGPGGIGAGSPFGLMQPFLSAQPSIDGNSEFFERRFRSRFKWLKNQISGSSGFDLPPNDRTSTPKLNDGPIKSEQVRTNGSSNCKGNDGTPSESRNNSSSPEGGNQSNNQLPVAYAIPQTPTSGAFIMQPFLITQPSELESDRIRDNFVPSLVYLPVSKKVMEPVTVAFQLTPA